MKRIKIANNIYVFLFEDSNSDFSGTITALLEDDYAILIDVSYKKNAIQVKQFLNSMGIHRFLIFLTHHHEDHIDGCKCFPDMSIYASNLFLSDYQAHLQCDDFLKKLKPNNWILDGDSYKSKSYNIDFHFTPGHNICGFSFLINDKILHAGDLIFEDKFKKPSIPYLDGTSDISDYLYALNKIKELNFDVLIQGHGSPIFGRAKILKEIDDRCYYLNRINMGRGKVELEDCLKDEIERYSGHVFHEKNKLYINH
uniref:MBL fold metallo-hydrolase n=1 Tax=uncultured Draconibacterium sp. TaxID=1573823 RepID=UPI0032180AEC